MFNNFKKKEEIWFCSDKECKKTFWEIENKTNSELEKLYIRCNDCWEKICIKSENKNQFRFMQITRWKVNTWVYTRWIIK